MTTKNIYLIILSLSVIVSCSEDKKVEIIDTYSDQYLHLSDDMVDPFANAPMNSLWQDMMPLFRAVGEEASKVVEKAGIKWISQEQVAKDWPEITAPLRGQLNTEAQSSTWQSLARHQGSVETDFLNGEIVRVAKQIGLKAPLNEKLVEITREMAASHEPPGKYTLTELSKMLGLEGDNQLKS